MGYYLMKSKNLELKQAYQRYAEYVGQKSKERKERWKQKDILNLEGEARAESEAVNIVKKMKYYDEGKVINCLTLAYVKMEYTKN